MSKNFATPTKKQARQETIIDLYREHYGRDSIPSDSQYWTMCASCVEPGTEFDQICSSGLIMPEQFHGVDKDASVIEQNRIHHPTAHWYHGDFYRSIRKARKDGNLNPAIINLDTYKSPEDGQHDLHKIIDVLHDHSVKNIMLVANFIGRHGYYKWGSVRSVRELNCGSLWSPHSRYYNYPGANNNNCIMKTYIFFKE